MRWAKSQSTNRNRAREEKKKADALEKEAEEARRELEACEALKWIEKFDEYSERIYFEHEETGEIAWDTKPKRGFVVR